MKIKFIICAIVMMSAGSAYGVKTPSDTEINDIQEQIYVANQMDKQIGDAAALVLKARKANQSEAHILRLERQVEREKDKQYAAWTKAIHMAILAYGLEPANWTGKSVMPWTKDREIKWLPRAREIEDHDVKVGGEVVQTVKKDKKIYVGMTYIDGVTIMDRSAFEKGPGYLASYLLHERIHFEQFTTTGKGDKMSYAEAQEAAYQVQVDNAEHFFNPDKPEELRLMQDIARFRDEEKAKSDLEKKERATLSGRLRGLLPRSRPPDAFDAKVHTNAELADISGLVAQARAQADIARRDREKREAIAQSAAEKASHRDHDERLSKIYFDLAQRSCAAPGSVSQAELDGLPEPHDTLYYLEKTPQSFGNCITNVYLYLGSRARPDAEEIRGMSAPIAAVGVPIPLPVEAVKAEVKRPENRLNPTTPFSAAFPRLKNLAVTACSSSGQVTFDNSLIQPNLPFSFDYTHDDPIAESLAVGLGDCPRQLFNKLIEMIRTGQGAAINSQWIRDRADAYSSSTGSVAPQTGGGDPCRDHGNIRCP